MRKRLKKFIAAALCFCMILPLAAVSFADEATVIDSAYTGSLSGDVIIKSGGEWHVEEDQKIAGLTIEEGGTITADYPVIIVCDKVEGASNGDVLNGFVQIVSDYDEVIAIVHTNDQHGYIQQEAYVKAYADMIRAGGEYDFVLTLNGGDVWTGGYPAGAVYNGELIPALMGQIYDVMIPGNVDELNLTGTYGTYGLLAALGEDLGMQFLVGNRIINTDVYDLEAYAATYNPVIGKEDFAALYDSVKLNEDGTLDYSALDLKSYNRVKGEKPMKGTTVFTTPGGTKLGIFGMSYWGTDTADWVRTPTIETAQELADELIDEGCTAIVGITHIGWVDNDPDFELAGSSNDTNSVQIALQTKGIDALVDGHTHSIANNGKGFMFGESNTFINQAYAYGQAIGLMKLYLKDGKVIAKSGSLTRDFTEWLEPDPEVQAMVDDIMARLEKDGYTTVYITTDVYLNGNRASAKNPGGAIRVDETNLGDLVADGVLSIAQDVFDDIEIAFYPGYWVRASEIEPGDITKVEVSSIFSNATAVYRKVYTAQELVDELTADFANAGITEDTKFIQTAGLKVQYVKGEAGSTVTDIQVGDTVVYKNGRIVVDDDWSVACAYTLSANAARNPAGAGWQDEDAIVKTNTELIAKFAEFLMSGEAVLYPNEKAPDGRITEKSAPLYSEEIVYDEASEKYVYYNEDGVFDSTYTGLARNEWGWWYVKDGEVDFTFTGLVQQFGWYWYVKDGMVDFHYNSLARNEWGWWKVTDGYVDFSFNGTVDFTPLSADPLYRWTIVKGQVTFPGTVIR